MAYILQSNRPVTTAGLGSQLFHANRLSTAQAVSQEQENMGQGGRARSRDAQSAAREQETQFREEQEPARRSLLEDEVEESRRRVAHQRMQLARERVSMQAIDDFQEWTFEQDRLRSLTPVEQAMSRAQGPYVYDLPREHYDFMGELIERPGLDNDTKQQLLGRFREMRTTMRDQAEAADAIRSVQGAVDREVITPEVGQDMLTRLDDADDPEMTSQMVRNLVAKETQFLAEEQGKKNNFEYFHGQAQLHLRDEEKPHSIDEREWRGRIKWLNTQLGRWSFHPDVDAQRMYERLEKQMQTSQAWAAPPAGDAMTSMTLGLIKAYGILPYEEKAKWKDQGGMAGFIRSFGGQYMEPGADDGTEDPLVPGQVRPFPGAGGGGAGPPLRERRAARRQAQGADRTIQDIMRDMPQDPTDAQLRRAMVELKMDPKKASDRKRFAQELQNAGSGED